jgi:membrane protein implicated in regulation of membrane protease activity
MAVRWTLHLLGGSLLLLSGHHTLLLLILLLTLLLAQLLLLLLLWMLLAAWVLRVRHVWLSLETLSNQCMSSLLGKVAVVTACVAAVDGNSLVR